MAKTNLFPTFDKWTINNGTGTEITDSLVVSDDGYSCSFTVTSEESYIRCRIQNEDIEKLRGHKLILHVDEFSTSDNEPFLRIRYYSDIDNGIYETINLRYADSDGVLEELGTMPFDYELEIPANCVRLEIRFLHYYDSDGIDPPALITISNASLVDTYQESLDTLNFHKVLEENLPTSVTPGTQHIYFTTDGTTVKQYISTKEGLLIPVGGVASGGSTTEEEYYNAYTQSNIDERKQEIVNLTKQGHCITFAVATDIHVRIEDGDAGRYNQVRDFIMLSDQLPLDYIFVEGDIMSYCQEWDGVYEPRCEKVRKIFDKCRCPWFVARGNHDFNEDDNGYQNNSNIKEFTVENCKDYFITDRDWHRSIASKMPRALNMEYHFDELHPHNGYFYVDDYNNKHRMVFCNTEETMENDIGEPYINENGELDAFLSSIASVAQIEWLIDHALNMKDKSDWVVSFHSHKIPYSDVNESDKSEFHGYGWQSATSANFRQLISAFQNGSQINFSVSAVDVDNHDWTTFTRNIDFTQQGAIKVLGWFGGHLHDDAYRKVDGINMHISTCTAPSQRTTWANDPNPVKLPPERNTSNLAMSVNVFVVNLDTRTVNVIKLGSKRDNSIKNSSDLTFTY